MNHFQYTDISGSITDFKPHTNIGTSKTSKVQFVTIVINHIYLIACLRVKFTRTICSL